MKEIVSILSHTDTTDKVDILNKCLIEIKKQGYQVMISSHIDIPKEILEQVDFFIYDKDNPIISLNEFYNQPNINIWQSYPGYHQSYLVNWNHSFAVLRLIKNSISIANINGYEKIHFVNYDYVLHENSILRNHSEQLENCDLFSYYQDEFEKSREHINTGLFSIKVQPYVEILKKINTKQDFLKTGQAVFEKYFFNISLENNLKVKLENQTSLNSELNILNAKATFKHVIENKIHIYLSKEVNTENYYIYVNSREGDIININIIQGEKNWNWIPTPFRVNLLKLPNDILKIGLKIHIPEYDYTDFYNLEKHFANCEITNRSLIQEIIWTNDFSVQHIKEFPEKYKNTISSFKELSIKYGTDKVIYHGYHYFYPNFIEPLRSEEFNMLEIGWGDGASIKVWNDYFLKANVYVMDINTEYQEGRQKVIKGDQSNEQDLIRVRNEIISAKFIIDDGSHNPKHQLDTFYYLFKNLLEPGGIYIIEDIELSYWNPESTLYGYKAGNINILYNMLKCNEMINHEFTKVQNFLEISTITYGQNCIIITKRTKEESDYFNREYRFIGCQNGIGHFG